MDLVPVKQDPEKWIRFYKASMGKNHGPIQRGSGGTLGPRTRGRGGFRVVDDVIAQHIVTPTEQVVQQAKSEVVRRKQRYKKPRMNPFDKRLHVVMNRKGSTLFLKKRNSSIKKRERKAKDSYS